MKTAVLWTGGKDSALAFQVSLNVYEIRRLVCFTLTVCRKRSLSKHTPICAELCTRFAVS